MIEITEEQIEQNYLRDHPEAELEPTSQPGESNDLGGESDEAVEVAEYREEDGMKFIGDGRYSFMVDRDYDASQEEAATLEGLASAAESAGLPPSDWNEVNAAFNSGIAEHDENPNLFAQKMNARHGEAEAFLKRTWGDSYDANLEAVREKADALGIRDHLHTSGLGNDPAAIMTLFKLCRK